MKCLVWLNFMHIIRCWSFNTKSCFYIYVVRSISFQIFLYRHLKLSYSWKFICYCYTSYEMTDFKFKWTATTGIGTHPTKAWFLQLVNFKMQSGRKDTLEERYVLNLGKLPDRRMGCFRLFFDHLARIEYRFLSGIRDSTKAGSLWWMMRGVGGVRKSIYQSWLAKGLG